MKIGYGGCVAVGNPMLAGYTAIDLGCTHFVMQGDAPYTNAAQTSWGVQIDDHTGDVFTQANFELFQQLTSLNPGIAHIRSALGSNFHYMPDDHECPGDNWDHTTATATLGAGAMTTPSQAQIDTAFANSWGAINVYYDWPVNNDPDAGDEAPSGAAAAASNYPPRYYRFKHGNIECFVLDCISHRDPLIDADGVGKTMLGSKQKAWLKSQLKASTATFKVIFSNKKLFAGTVSENGDGWPGFGAYTGYETERDELLAFIEAGTDWEIPGGVFWGTSDRHTPEVQMANQTADTEPTFDSSDSYDVASVCMGTLDQPVNPTPTEAGTNTLTINPEWEECFGIVDESDEKLRVSVHDSVSGKVRWRGYVLPGENKFTYPDLRVAI